MVATYMYMYIYIYIYIYIFICIYVYIYMQRINGFLGRDIINHTAMYGVFTPFGHVRCLYCSAMYGVFIPFWPILVMKCISVPLT